jgi:hypothetical protein
MVPAIAAHHNDADRDRVPAERDHQPACRRLPYRGARAVHIDQGPHGPGSQNGHVRAGYPLVGISLEAARRAAPCAFAHYYDKGELFSANMIKNFRNRGLLESPDHKIYSFRHAFEKRMQEANIDYGLRCLLMGHKTTRPVYGEGGSLSYRRDELLKIAHPFDALVMELFERENPGWALGGELDGS